MTVRFCCNVCFLPLLWCDDDHFSEDVEGGMTLEIDTDQVLNSSMDIFPTVNSDYIDDVIQAYGDLQADRNSPSRETRKSYGDFIFLPDRVQRVHYSKLLSIQAGLSASTLAMYGTAIRKNEELKMPSVVSLNCSPGEPPLYLIMDGHHRIAAKVLMDHQEIDCRVFPAETMTSLELVNQEGLEASCL